MNTSSELLAFLRTHGLPHLYTCSFFPHCAPSLSFFVESTYSFFNTHDLKISILILLPSKDGAYLPSPSVLAVLSNF